MECPKCKTMMHVRSSRVWSSKAEGPVQVYYHWCPKCFHTVDIRREPIREVANELPKMQNL